VASELFLFDVDLRKRVTIIVYHVKSNPQASSLGKATLFYIQYNNCLRAIISANPSSSDPPHGAIGKLNGKLRKANNS
jgi:hypothetical protein